jgi:hypothetical protein
LFAREAKGLQVVRGVDLKGPKAAGRVTGTQWGVHRAQRAQHIAPRRMHATASNKVHMP